MATRTGVVVMGAGPAGLSAADELARHDVDCVVVEKDQTSVGGIARTVDHQGWRFDVGPHRFFSKSSLIEQRWREWLGDDFIECDRLTRILYRGRYFDYPIKPANALLGLGPLETVRCIASYGLAKAVPVRTPRSFEEWVSNQFGRRLFSIFFKTYTEKVWGIPTSELSADWAAQRIKGLDLFTAVRSALLPSAGIHRSRSDARPSAPSSVDSGSAGGRGRVIKTLIDRFHYPRLGAGQMWDRVAALARERGVRVQLGAEVVRIDHEGGRTGPRPPGTRQAPWRPGKPTISSAACQSGSWSRAARRRCRRP